MRQPLIIAADGNRTTLHRLRPELDRRYGRDFRVQDHLTGADVLAELEDARVRGDSVAMVLAANELQDDIVGSQLLARVRLAHPDARRALLIDWGAWGEEATAAAILHAMARGDIDYYVLKPWTSPDELFHRTVTEFLHEWARNDVLTPREVVVVGGRHSARGHRVRSLLSRNGIPHTFHDRESAQGETVLAHVGQSRGSTNVVVWMPALGGKVLIDPADVDIVSGSETAASDHGPARSVSAR